MHQLALERVPFSLVISNPNIEDNPIVFVNQAFTRLTGYSAEVTVGRNCRFLQGPDTDPKSVEAMRTGIAAKHDFTVEILNYRADQTPFLNRVHISPLNDESGNLQYFVGLQRAAGSRTASGIMADELDDALREIHHRVKNHLSMVVGMIRMQARVDNADSVQNYTTLARRIETLQFLYDEMTVGGRARAGDRIVSLGAYVSRIASAIAYLDGRESIRLNLDVANVRAPIDTAAQVGLVVSELLTNAYQHAFSTRIEGLIEVRLMELSDGTIRLQVSDDGVGLAAGARWPDGGNLGGRIVRSLITGLNAELGVSGGARGVMVTVDVPPSAIHKPAEAPAGNGTQVAS
ncbi:PAS domain-containing protein [Acuticoccus kandeliae]|uniref:PAS domain-containing protein n=1 Tax=Acuticoccus kandeliae TaxID=2073160 RepID=UPI000D3EBD54|nr:PAS domain-containing protein [Acuticoccus kandeliae]